MDKNRIPYIKNSKKANFILAAGLILILAGLVLCVMTVFAGAGISVFKSLFFLVLGEFLLFCTLAFNRNILFFYIGITLILDGIAFFLIENSFIPFFLSEAWPLFLINFGIAFIPAGFYRYKRVSTAFLFPALAIIVIGVTVLLFSTHIIKIPFIKFISVFGPIVMALCGIFLVVLFALFKIESDKLVYFKDDTVDLDAGNIEN